MLYLFEFYLNIESHDMECARDRLWTEILRKHS